jgi:tetratricopeptide (TPR) repeat protein/anti-sigma regulatory factor (Ser/Thr protein kinase)
MFLGVSVPQPINLTELEHKLKHQREPHQRMVLIDQLAANYAFTNISRAQTLLQEFFLILEDRNDPDMLLNFHLYSAIIENQLYRYERADYHFGEAIHILKERGTAKQQAETYIDYSGTCINLDEMDKALHYLEAADKLLKSFPDERLRSRIICREGFLHLHYSNYSRAIELLLDADRSITTLEQPLELKDYYFLTLIHSGLGKIYERNDEREKSVDAYLKVVNMCETMGIRTRLSWHYLNVGNGYSALGEQEKAETYYQRAIEVADDSSEFARASSYANLGFCYLEKENYEQALQLFDRAETLFKKLPNDAHDNLAVISSWRGQIYQELGEKEKVHEQLHLALKYAKLDSDYKQLAGVCKDLAAFYAERKDFENAYRYQCMYDEYSERYIEQVDMRKQREVEAKYQVEKRRQETEMLRLEATRLQLKALRAQMNPHFMYNALNSIQNFITSNEVTYAAKYLAKFAKLMRRSLDYSDMEIISLEKEIEFLEDYLYINEKLRFEDQLKYEIIIDEEIEEDILGVPTMIVQPYVENAIEHGLRGKKSGLIKVLFFLYDEDTILCRIEDNGVGRKKARERQLKDPQFKNHRSRGTSITEKRLEVLHRSTNADQRFIEIIDLVDEETQEAKGTRVEIKIPVVEVHMR